MSKGNRREPLPWLEPELALKVSTVNFHFCQPGVIGQWGVFNFNLVSSQYILASGFRPSPGSAWWAPSQRPGQALILSRDKLEDLLHRIEPLPAPAYAVVVAVAYWYSLSKVLPRCRSPAGNLACGPCSLQVFPVVTTLPSHVHTFSAIGIRIFSAIYIRTLSAI